MCNKVKIEDIEKGKKIFYDNFGSQNFMQKNNELKSYKKLNIPIEIEKSWTLELEKTFIKNIIKSSVSDIIAANLWYLASLNISDEKKIDDFIFIQNQKSIKEEIIIYKALYDTKLFNDIIEKLYFL